MGSNLEGAPVSGKGAIVLAAYRPESAAFRRQLTSIASQAHGDWVAVISPDSGAGRIAEMVRSTVGADPRFSVLASGDRLGYYRNFERGLKAIPAGIRWVALADQDDEWYPDKLNILLPLLSTHILVCGQARVTTEESLTGPVTDRRATSTDGLLISNQVTGSFCVFRVELLQTALPFPPAPPGAFHDHWLALCANGLGSIGFANQAVQRYIQHGGNVVGEDAATVTERVTRLFRGGLSKAVDRLVRERLGWRRTMAATLAERLPATSSTEVYRTWAQDRLRLGQRIVRAAARREAPPLRALGLLAALPLESLWSSPSSEGELHAS